MPNINILAALKIIDSVRARKSLRLLDVIYGPRAAGVRAVVATMLRRDGLVLKSHREAQYGRLRDVLVSAIGATGSCIAAVDTDFETRARAMLDSEVAGLSREDHDRWINEAYGKPATCRACGGPLNPETGECSDLGCGVPKVSYERKR